MTTTTPTPPDDARRELEQASNLAHNYLCNEGHYDVAERLAAAVYLHIHRPTPQAPAADGVTERIAVLDVHLACMEVACNRMSAHIKAITAALAARSKT